MCRLAPLLIFLLGLSLAPVASANSDAPVASRSLHGGEPHGAEYLLSEHEKAKKWDEAHGISQGEEGHGEGHGEEGHGEGHGGGHGGHHEKPNGIAMAVSGLLLGFMVANFLLLWLVNWEDGNVRKYMWSMMSSTISIYLAVLCNNLFRDFTNKIFLGHKEASDEQLVPYFIIRVSTFVLFFILSNVACWMIENSDLQPKWMYACRILAGHLVAFAGIDLFEKFAHVNEEMSILLLVAICFLALIILMRFISRRVRDWVDGKQEGIEAKKTPEWRKAVVEAEDDGLSIFFSYVTQALLICAVFGMGTYKSHNWKSRGAMDIVKLGACGAAVCGALVLLSFLKKITDLSAPEAKEVGTSGYKRTMSSAQITIAMTSSWLALKGFWWLTSDYVRVSHEMIEIMSAFLLTGVAILVIIVLDKVADQAGKNKGEDESDGESDSEEDEEKKKPEEVPPPVVTKVAPKEDPMWKAFCCSPSSYKQIPANPPVQQAQPMVPKRADTAEELQKKLLGAGSMERAIRVVIGSCALAVGLSWEKAFHAATEVMIESSEFSERHYLISQGILAVLNILIMVPPWLKYIVPLARKSAKHHEAMIKLSKKHDKRRGQR